MIRRMAVVSFSLVVGLGCGGGGGHAKERMVCAHVEKLCGGKEPLDECASKMRELKEPAGETYDQFLDCTLEATSCPELAGCFAGGLGEVAERWGRQFEKGLDRMRSKRSKDSPRPRTGMDDDDPHAGIGGSGADEAMAQAMTKMSEMTARMCRCKDRSCADKVQEDMATWGAAQAKNATRDMPARMSVEDMKKMAEVTKQYGDCMMKAMGAPDMSGTTPAGGDEMQ